MSLKTYWTIYVETGGGRKHLHFYETPTRDDYSWIETPDRAKQFYTKAGAQEYAKILLESAPDNGFFKRMKVESHGYN